MLLRYQKKTSEHISSDSTHPMWNMTPPHHPWRVPVVSMVSSCLRGWLGRRTLGEDAHAALADVQKPLEQAGPAILLAVAGESWNGWKVGVLL